MRAMKPLCSGINVSTNAGSNARTSPDLLDQQKQLTGRSLSIDSRKPIVGARARMAARVERAIGPPTTDFGIAKFEQVALHDLGSDAISLHRCWRRSFSRRCGLHARRSLHANKGGLDRFRLYE